VLRHLAHGESAAPVALSVRPLARHLQSACLLYATCVCVCVHEGVRVWVLVSVHVAAQAILICGQFGTVVAFLISPDTSNSYVLRFSHSCPRPWSLTTRTALDRAIAKLWGLASEAEACDVQAVFHCCGLRSVNETGFAKCKPCGYKSPCMYEVSVARCLRLARSMANRGVSFSLPRALADQANRRARRRVDFRGRWRHSSRSGAALAGWQLAAAVCTGRPRSPPALHAQIALMMFAFCARENILAGVMAPRVARGPVEREVGQAPDVSALLDVTLLTGRSRRTCSATTGHGHAAGR
jgi:hypothetical protein